MQSPHILVIDDELQMRRLLRASLSERGYQVTAVGSCNEGLDAATSFELTAILLDLGLPDGDGIEVCRQIRSWSSVPIIIISARYDEQEKVRALDSGADDYLTKPFGVAELLARVRVVQRHSEQRSAHIPLITSGDLRIDTARRRVTQAGTEVRLTPTEYALLTVLASEAGRILTHDLLIERVWGPAYAGNMQNLHVFVSQLRRKIEPQPATPHYILTEPGVGYRFCIVTNDQPA